MDKECTSPCIVPLADMMNHAVFDPHNYNWSNYYFDNESQSFKVFVNYNYSIGEQVFFFDRYHK